MSSITSSSEMSRTSRWCPTHEQLAILKELYRGGLRTPKAPLIQKITAHLSSYGKVEGKNVFYWFQNHKARDKQNLRRKMSMQLFQKQLFQDQPLLLSQQHYQQFLLNNFLPPLFPPTFYQPHGSSEIIHQGMGEDVSSGRDKILKLNVPNNNEDESYYMAKSYGREMVAPIMSILPSCNNKRPPLKTLDLFPTTSTTLREQNSEAVLQKCSTK